MASIDGLPADQRAVLELVLRRGRSYDEIAQLLSIDRAGVRQRALAAFDALGPQTRIAPDRRALITDYLLGALPAGVAREVHDHLGASASERAWARAIASELQGVSDHPLPEIPSNGSVPRASGREAAEHPSGREAAEHPADSSVAAADGSPRDRPLGRSGSRVGGAILLAAGAAVAIALVLVFVVFAGPSTHRHGSATASRSRASAAPAATNATAKIISRITLTSPTGGSSPVGLAAVIEAQKRFGVAIAATGLTANSKRPANAYAVWLYNSPSDSYILGFVNPAVGSNGQLKTAGGLPQNASHYRKLLVTLETRSKPTTPGRIVLEGNLTGL